MEEVGPPGEEHLHILHAMFMIEYFKQFILIFTLQSEHNNNIIDYYSL